MPRHRLALCFAIAFILTLIAVLAMPWFAAHAADPFPAGATNVVAMDAPAATADGQLVAFVLGFVEKHPRLGTVLVLVALLRSVLKPVFSVLESDPRTADATRRVEESPGFRVVAWLLDYFCSIKVRALPRAGGATALLMALALLGAAPFLAGCATGGGFKATDLVPLVDSAAYTGSVAVITAHPEKREVFVQAEGALTALINSGRVTLTSLKAALDPILQADIRELRDARTALLVDGAVTIADAALGRYQLDDQRTSEVLAVAVAARNGIARANVVTQPR